MTVSNSPPATRAVRAPTEPPTDPRITSILSRVPSGADVLDIGCVDHSADRATERNWLHKHLYGVASHVAGIDYLETDVQRLRDEGYNVHHANAEQFDLGRTFDAVVAGELLEHIPNPGAFLGCALDHLADGGRLILTTPNVWGAAYLKRLLLPREVHCNEEHQAWYCRRTLRQLLERNGFEMLDHEYIQPPLRRDGHGEYLSWGLWHVGRQRRLAALDHLVVATPGGGQ